jgi:hypothetical protein
MQDQIGTMETATSNQNRKISHKISQVIKNIANIATNIANSELKHRNIRNIALCAQGGLVLIIPLELKFDCPSQP